MVFLKRLFIAIFMFSGAAQATVLDISLSPSTKTADLNEVFNIDIIGSLAPTSGIATLDAGALLLSFDPGVIHLGPIGYTSPWVDFGTTAVDNTAGTAALAFGAFSSIPDPTSFVITTLSVTAAGRVPAEIPGAKAFSDS